MSTSGVGPEAAALWRRKGDLDRAIADDDVAAARKLNPGIGR
jgi:hypothetical protein